MTGRWREGARNVAGRSKEGVREMMAGKRPGGGRGRKETERWQERGRKMAGKR